MSTDSNQTRTERGRGRWLAVLAFLYIVLVSFAVQGVGWGGPLFGLPLDADAGFRATLAQSVALLAPLFILGLITRTGRYHAMLQTWLAAALILLALAPTRLLPPTEGQSLQGLQIVVLLVAYLILRVLAPVPTQASRGGLAIGLGLGLLAGLPWVIVGAPGSYLDTLLAVGLGVAFGLVGAQSVARFWLAPSGASGRGVRRELFTGGVVVGTAWLILASGISMNGVQLALMIALPAFGWAAMALTFAGSERPRPELWPAVALLAGTITALALAFLDPDGMNVVSQDPIFGSGIRAALAAAGIGWLAGLVAWSRAKGLPQMRGGKAAWAVPVVALIAALALYATGGQTGTYGDSLFVVLRDQADVSSASRMPDYDSRRQFVYDTLTAHAERTQAPLRAALDRFGVDYTPYYLVNALEVQGGLPLRLWLEGRPEVDRVMPSPALRPAQSQLEATTGGFDKPDAPQWNLTSIGAPRVWQELGATGAGIVVGQSDSGAEFDHPEIADSYRGRSTGDDYNWLDPWYGTTAPVDYGGHGTHTLGSVLGNSVGVAPDADWIACANLPRNLGNPARYLDCMQFMLAPFPQKGDPLRDGDPTRSAQVLNNSWGCPQDFEGCDPGSLRPAVAALRSAGIFVVASAGNDGPACSSLTDPIAIYDEAFTVGAIDEEGNLAPFSSRGPVTADGSGRTKPDIVAPGVEILSGFPGGTYEVTSGTSMAGPHVVGVVALMWSANPNLIGDIETTEAILIQTARPFEGDSGEDCGPGGQPDNDSGYGVVDAFAAVQAAQALR